MTRDQLTRETARHTGVLLEVVDLVIDTFIDEIKAAVERGEHVSLNEFMKIRLREKRSTRATHFPTGQRMVVESAKTPWVTVSRKWRAEVRKKYSNGNKEILRPSDNTDNPRPAVGVAHKKIGQTQNILPEDERRN